MNRFHMIPGISFPKLDGRMDCRVFVGIDLNKMRRAGDLLEDQWSRSGP